MILLLLHVVCLSSSVSVVPKGALQVEEEVQGVQVVLVVQHQVQEVEENDVVVFYCLGKSHHHHPKKQSLV
jgi:hypothetical protein